RARRRRLGGLRRGRRRLEPQRALGKHRRLHLDRRRFLLRLDLLERGVDLRARRDALQRLRRWRGGQIRDQIRDRVDGQRRRARDRLGGGGLRRGRGVLRGEVLRDLRIVLGIAGVAEDRRDLGRHHLAARKHV